MRRVLVPAVLALTFSLLACVSSQAQQGDVTLNAKRLPLGRIATMLARLARVTINVDPQLANYPLTVQFERATVESAVQTVFETLRVSVPDAQLDWKDKVYQITLKPGGKVPPPPRQVADDPARTFTLALANVPLREALALVYRKPGVDAKDTKPPVEVEPGVQDPPVTLTFSHDNERVAARLLVRQARSVARDLGYADKDGKLVVGVIPGFRSGSPEEAQELFAPPLPDPQRRLVISLRNTPLRQALMTMYDHTLPRFQIKHQVELGETVPNTPISFSMITADPKQAAEAFLAALKEQIPGLVVERAGEKLKLSHKSP